jgi:hypothetical protein
VVLKNTRDKHQFSHLARQVYAENSKRLYEAYLEATENPYGYLLVDLTQDTGERIRYLNDILPDEKPVLFFVPTIGGKSNETIQLSYSTRA